MLALKRLSSSTLAASARGYATSGYASTAKNLLINADTKVIFQGSFRAHFFASSLLGL